MTDFLPDVIAAADAAMVQFLRDQRCGMAVRFGMVGDTQTAVREAICGAIVRDRAGRGPDQVDVSGLTPRMAEALRFLVAYQATHDGVSPTFDEIATALNLVSKSGVARLIRGLEDRGRVRRAPGLARAITVLPPPNGHPPRSGQVAGSGHRKGV